MEVSQIFEESESEEKANFVTYSDNIKGENYVSQFLNGVNAGQDVRFHEPEVGQAEEMPDFEEFLIDVQQEVPEEKEKSKKKPRAECSFHNFQKHLVTTIKYNISLDKLQLPLNLKECVQKIWEAFKNSKKLNKTLICMLFVDLHQENPFKVAQYGFGNILEEFPAEITLESQRFLSNYIAQELRDLNLQKLLTHRRMKNKNDFILYFKEFMKEVESGDLEKRMIKCTKLMKKLNQKNKLEA